MLEVLGSMLAAGAGCFRYFNPVTISDRYSELELAVAKWFSFKLFKILEVNGHAGRS